MMLWNQISYKSQTHPLLFQMPWGSCLIIYVAISHLLKICINFLIMNWIYLIKEVFIVKMNYCYLI